jgi:hypothetical protein
MSKTVNDHIGNSVSSEESFVELSHSACSLQWRQRDIPEISESARGLTESDEERKRTC